MGPNTRGQESRPFRAQDLEQIPGAASVSAGQGPETSVGRTPEALKPDWDLFKEPVGGICIELELLEGSPLWYSRAQGA